MPQGSSKTIAYGTKAAIGVVLVALVLGAVGLVMAIRTTQLLADQRIHEVRGEAERIARDLQDQILARTTRALRTVARECSASDGELPIDDPMPRTRSPIWLGDLFLINDSTTRYWRAPATAGQSVSPHAPGKLLALARAAALQQLLLTNFLPPVDEAVFQHDEIDGDTVVLALIVVQDSGSPAFVVGASLDLHRLRESYLEPLVSSASERTRLVDAAVESRTWSEPLDPLLPFLALQPTEEFVDSVVGSAKRQTGILVGITVLALVTLWSAVWALIRVVRRDMALTEMKSAFVADVSHELKTPLSLIRMFGETLAEGRVASQEKRQEYYEIITRESARLTHMINNILDFSRIDAGRKRYKLTPLDVGQVAQETYDSYRHDLDHNGFTHQLSIAPDLPTVHGDADAISQALLNLLNNAVKYSEDEKDVELSVAPETRRDRHGVLISVHDRGIGISPEARRFLFEGFYRAPDERVRRKRGAGLGLALVKHIVDAHGGIIDVESRLVKGTTFRIFLPQNPPGAGPVPEGE